MSIDSIWHISTILTTALLSLGELQVLHFSRAVNFYHMHVRGHCKTILYEETDTVGVLAAYEI